MNCVQWTGQKTAGTFKILTEFKDLKNIAMIQCNGKTQLTGSIQSRDGDLKTNRKDIADVFADFYEALYADLHGKADDGRYKYDVTPGEVDDTRADEVKAI